MQMFIYSALVGFMVMAAVVEIGFCTMNPDDKNTSETQGQVNKAKPAAKEESLRDKEQKAAGILDQDVDYAKTSDADKYMDRTTGTLKVGVDAAAKAGKEVAEKVKTLF